MKHVELKFGGRNLRLLKVDAAIAIKPRRNFDRNVGHRLAALPVHEVRALGGFTIVKAEPATMENTLDTLRESPAVAAGTHVYQTSDDGVPFVPTGELYVKWREDASRQEKDALLREFKLNVQETRGEQTVVLRITSESPNPLKVAAAFQQSSAVAIAEPDLATPGVLHSLILPTDPLLDAQWHLRNTGMNGGSDDGLRRGADARVVAAWEHAGSLGSAAISVALIDDGFDLGHPDLSGPGRQVGPWDFTRETNDPRPDWAFDTRGRFTGDWHGTACAGIAIGASQGSGIVGAAPGCRFMPVRWGPDLSQARVEKWFQYVRRQGAAVVSCSWSAAAKNFPLSTRIHEAIHECARDGRGGLGTIVCFAAGNEARDIDDLSAGSVNGFAIHPDVIAVAASTSMDERAHYSNYGDAIWICAPSSGAGGRGILTSDVRGTANTPHGSYSLGYDSTDFTAEFGGTSSSTPLVAGICGFLLSIRPQTTATEIRQLLKRTARKIGTGYDANGHSREYGHGCIDALAAARAILDIESATPAVGIHPLWGKDGHNTTNGKAIEALPPELEEFFQRHKAQIVEESMAADHAKDSDPDERPRHFLDADRYGPPPFADLPEEYEEAVAKFGKDTIIRNGLLPWTIVRRYESLVTAFRAGSVESIVHHSAWLGHYIGDSHVPLHTTENHDGQLTGQRKLHSYFESTVLKFVEPAEVVPKQGRRFTKPILTLAFEWIRESHAFIPAILAADLGTRRGPQRTRDKRAFAARVKPIALDRLENGASRLASAWYSAWISAGRPRLGAFDTPPPVSGRRADARLPKVDRSQKSAK